jgi:hypothetical protein
MDPFFRLLVKTTVQQAISNSTPFNAYNPGTAEERCAIITLTGPLDHPIITNAANGVALTYGGILTSESVVIDCAKFTAVKTGAINVIGLLEWTGDVVPMALVSGDNLVSVVDGSNTGGVVKFEFYPPYL